MNHLFLFFSKESLYLSAFLAFFKHLSLLLIAMQWSWLRVFVLTVIVWFDLSALLFCVCSRFLRYLLTQQCSSECSSSLVPLPALLLVYGCALGSYLHVRCHVYNRPLSSPSTYFCVHLQPSLIKTITILLSIWIALLIIMTVLSHWFCILFVTSCVSIGWSVSFTVPPFHFFYLCMRTDYDGASLSVRSLYVSRLMSAGCDNY